MTNKEAIRMLIRLEDRINWEVTDAQKKMDALNMAIKALEQEPKWIPVSERLPEKVKGVLVTTCRTGYGNEKSYFIETACRYGEVETGIEWACAHDDIVIDDSEYQVIAWMPLPEPMRLENK